MKHFRSEEWVDFVNQKMPQKRIEGMKAHLEAGCKSCRGQLEMWSKVQKFAAAEAGYQPPEQAMRAAVALLGTAQWAAGAKKKVSFIELLFDSFLQPALAGARAAGTGIRQLLFRAGSYQIDLQIEARPGNSHIVITGQVLDVTQSEVRGGGLHVVLGNKIGNTLHTVTNEFGEFYMEFKNSGDLELTLAGEDRQSIVISLGDPLLDAPGEPAGARN